MIEIRTVVSYEAWGLTGTEHEGIFLKQWTYSKSLLQ